MLNVLISIALVFIALVLACAVWVSRLPREPAKPGRPSSPARRHFGSVPRVQPVFGKAVRGHSRAELEAITARARERAAADPMGLNRPLSFRSVQVPSGTAADGGDQVHPGFPAVRYFRMIRGDRQEAGNV